MFRNCKTIQEAKTLYRKLSICLHPDKGGSVEMMSLLNDVYEDVKLSFGSRKAFDDYLSDYKAKPRTERKKKPKEEMVDKIEKDKCWILISEVAKYIDKPYFPKDFFRSLKNYLESMGYLTVKQFKCLEGIRNQFLSDL